MNIQFTKINYLHLQKKKLHSFTFLKRTSIFIGVAVHWESGSWHVFTCLANKSYSRKILHKQQAWKQEKICELEKLSISVNYISSVMNEMSMNTFFNTAAEKIFQGGFKVSRWPPKRSVSNSVSNRKQCVSCSSYSWQPTTISVLHTTY